MMLLDLCDVSTEGTRTILTLRGSGSFVVSLAGSVRRIKRSGALKPELTSSLVASVPMVSLGLGHKYPLEWIVALCYLPNPTGLPMIGHKDKDPFNCAADNLYWTSCNSIPRTDKRFLFKHYHKAFLVLKKGVTVEAFECCVDALMYVGLDKSTARSKIIQMLNGKDYSQGDWNIQLAQYASTEPSVVYHNGKLALQCVGCGDLHLLRDYQLQNKRRARKMLSIRPKCRACINKEARVR